MTSRKKTCYFPASAPLFPSMYQCQCLLNIHLAMINAFTEVTSLKLMLSVCSDLKVELHLNCIIYRAWVFDLNEISVVKRNFYLIVRTQSFCFMQKNNPCTPTITSLHTTVSSCYKYVNRKALSPKFYVVHLKLKYTIITETSWVLMVASTAATLVKLHQSPLLNTNFITIADFIFQ